MTMQNTYVKISSRLSPVSVPTSNEADTQPTPTETTPKAVVQETVWPPYNRHASPIAPRGAGRTGGGRSGSRPAPRSRRAETAYAAEVSTTATARGIRSTHHCSSPYARATRDHPAGRQATTSSGSATPGASPATRTPTPPARASGALRQSCAASNPQAANTVAPAPPTSPNSTDPPIG
ncbi:hypothetical protein ACFQ0B_14115 [Nonomuraea thailandensis]